MGQAIYIGIGGAGMTTVAHLKANLLKDPDYNGDINRLTQDNHFIFIDTDEEAHKKINEDAYLRKCFKGKSPFGNEEFIYLGETKPFSLYNNAKNSINNPNSNRLLEWVIPQEKSGNYKLPSNQLSRGAGAQRIAGRMAIAQNWDKVIKAIQSGLLKLKDFATQVDNMNFIEGNDKQDQIDKEIQGTLPGIWVFASSNGGTGSSSFLDVLYIADRLFKHKYDCESYLRLVLYMPQPFIEKNKNNVNYYLNAFSSFWELNAFRYDWANNNDGHKFKHFSAKVQDPTWDNIIYGWNVYSYLIPVDAYTQHQESISIEEMFTNTAMMCYYLQKSAVAGSVIAGLDNDLKAVEIVNNPRIAKDTPYRWTKSLVAVGYRALCKPDDFLKEYVETRMLFDLFNYGLLGYEFSDICKTDKETIIAKEDFANKYILQNLTDDNNPESLKKHINSEFDKVRFPFFDNGTPSKKEWNDIWVKQKLLINEKKTLIEQVFENEVEFFSKKEILNRIIEKINEGTEESILKYGLRYTAHLIYLVDDKYCEDFIKKLETELPSEKDLQIIEQSIINIIDKKDIKKDFPKLEKEIKRFKELVSNKLLYKQVIKILENLTVTNTGYLEILRSGSFDNNCIGLKGVIDNIQKMSNTYSDNFKTLSKRFGKTVNDVFTQYLPSISKFGNDTHTWNDDNYFEKLYSDVITLDKREKRLGNRDMGTPPLRFAENQKGLYDALKEIIQNTNISNYFVTMAIQGESTYLKEVVKVDSFLDNANVFIKKLFDSENDISKFLNTNLETLFYEFYGNGNNSDSEKNKKRESFIKNFSESIPILYPQRSGSEGVNQHHTLYVGNSRNLAQEFGFVEIADKQFVEEHRLKDRFLIFKVEVGHNLYDYQRFDDISAIYNKNKKKIEALEFGSHIHKEFVGLNLDKLVIKRTNNALVDMIKLAYYNSFFKFLFENEETLFKQLWGNGNNNQTSRFGSKKVTQEVSKYEDLIHVSYSNSSVTIIVNLLNSDNYTLKLDGKKTIIINNIDNLSSFEKALQQETFSFCTQLLGIDSIIKKFNSDTVDLLKDMFIKSWHDIDSDASKTLEIVFVTLYKENQPNDIEIANILEEEINGLIENNCFNN